MAAHWQDSASAAGVAHSLVEGIDWHADPMSWLTEPRMCRCGVTLLAWIGGERHLQEELQAAAQQYRSEQDIKHQLPGCWAAYTAVRAGDSFADWGVVDTRADQRCVSCRSRNHLCKHVQQLRSGATADSAPTMASEKFEKMLAEQLDAVTGQRRLRGLSRQHLPEVMCTYPELLRVLTGQFKPDGSCSQLTLKKLPILTNPCKVHRCTVLSCPRLVDCRARRGQDPSASAM